MDYVVLGRTGLRVSRLALGTALLGLVPPKEEAEDLVRAALNHGINLFDCANTYGNRATFDRPGMPPAAERMHAEELLGLALRGIRDEVVLCTKVSEPVGPGVNDGGFGTLIPGGVRGGGLSRYHIMREVERSLRRLATDHIDIYHFHHPDSDTAIEETLRAADDLVRQGKVRYIALSTYPAWQMTQAVMTADHADLARPVLNQVHYNLLSREVEADVVPAALEFGVGLTCFSPLAGGALAGTDVLQRQYVGAKRWGHDQDFSVRQKEAAANLEELADAWGSAPAQLALAWLLSRPAVSTAIIGPENAAELSQNASAADLRLDAEQCDQLSRAVSAS